MTAMDQNQVTFVSEVTEEVIRQWTTDANRRGADRILLANYGSEGDEICPVYLQPGDSIETARENVLNESGRPGRVIEIAS